MRAILIRRLPDGTGRAVLNVPRGSPDYVDVPAIVIPPARPGFAAVGPRSISRDRHRIVLPSANGVVVVNVLTAEMRAFPADLSQAESVGFSSDESSIVLSSLGNPQRIVLATGDVQTMAPPGDAGRFRLVVDAAPNLLGFDGRGGAVAQYAVGAPINGFGSPTVTSQSGWSAAATVFNAAIMPAHAGRGILAVTVDVSPSATALVLAQADDRGDATPCCSALAWAPSDRALCLSASPTVWRILAWDVPPGSSSGSANCRRRMSGRGSGNSPCDGRDRPLRVGDPLAPRPDVGRGVEPCSRERQGPSGRQVTPEPHDVATMVDPSIPASAARPRISSGDRKVPSPCCIRPIGRFTAPGWAGHRIDRLHLSAIALRSPHVDEYAVRRRPWDVRQLQHGQASGTHRDRSSPLSAPNPCVASA